MNYSYDEFEMTYVKDMQALEKSIQEYEKRDDFMKTFGFDEIKKEDQRWENAFLNHQ